jgi:CDP-4-dehydro-6-deoxyglucose reductase, E3
MSDTLPLENTLAPPAPFAAELVGIRTLSPSVKEFTLRKPGAFHFDAGQWVNLMLTVPGHGELKRSYSIASAPQELGIGEFQLAITKVDGGPGSTYIHSLTPGATLQVVGPHGLFLHRHAGPSLFVGTGTGVTPLRSMFRDILRRTDIARTRTQPPMWLLFGVRHEEDALYQEELRELTEKHPHFKVFYTLSQPKSASERTGYVQTHTRELYEALQRESGAEPHVFICGLQKMINSVRDLLRKEMGLARQLVHSERYD